MTILTTSSITATVKPAGSGSTQRVRTVDSVSTPVPTTPSAPPPPPVQVEVQAVASQLEQVQAAIDRLKQSIKPTLANSLEFHIDQSTGKAVVMILDKETNTVVRQIPSEEVLSIARALDRMQGRGGLVRQQV